MNVQRALLSVYRKDGIVELARGLAERGFEIAVHRRHRQGARAGRRQGHRASRRPPASRRSSTGG